MNDNNIDYDNILVDAINPQEDVITDTAVNQHLKSLQSQLNSSVKPDNDYIEHLISTIKKTVKQEDSLIRHLVYTGLSAYSKDPINLE